MKKPQKKDSTLAAPIQPHSEIIPCKMDPSQPKPNQIKANQATSHQRSQNPSKSLAITSLCPIQIKSLTK